VELDQMACHGLQFCSCVRRCEAEAHDHPTTAALLCNLHMFILRNTSWRQPPGLLLIAPNGYNVEMPLRADKGVPHHA